MNNDEPKDDDWAMSNENINLNHEETDDDILEGFSSQNNQNSEDDWTITPVNNNQQQPDFVAKDDGKAMQDENLSPEEDWAMNVSDKNKTVDSVTEDWGMTAPNANLSHHLSTESDKTAPNFEIPKEVSEDNPSQQSETVSDEWMISMPYIAPRKEKKEGEWQMPPPVFRVTQGRKATPIKSGNQIQRESDIPQINAQETFPNQSTTAETQPQDLPPNSAYREPQAKTTPKPSTKKSSKILLLIGGGFAFLVFSSVALVGVYFVLLRGADSTSKKDDSSGVTASSPAETASTAGQNPQINSAANEKKELPKEIEYKGTMMLVSEGKFTMGSDIGEENSKPAHEVEVEAFYIDKTEVTNAEYKKFCEETGRNTPVPQAWNKDYFSTRPNAPVVGVSFEDARAFAEWAGKRLPTEQEWEKAASWDNEKKLKYLFPWGNRFESEKAAYDIAELADVGKYPAGASPSGVLDMAGNALEWVESYYKPYPNSQAVDSNFGKTNRVVRGGHFSSKSSDTLKTTKRIWIPPGFLPDSENQSFIGFRCAISANDQRLKEVLSK